jgi:hypothetical protein
MKRIFTLLTLFTLIQSSFAQQTKFSKVYFDNIGSFSADGMAKSFDGGLIVTGIYNNTSSVMKIDSMGSIVWAYSFGQGQNESVNAIVRTSDSCFVMTGKTFDTISNTIDIFVTKIDQSGNHIWSKVVTLPGNQESFAMSLTDDGGFILAGNESYVGPPHNRILVSKLDSLGEVEWTKVYQGGNNTNYGNAVKQTPDGGYAVVGYVEDYPPFDGNGLLLKLSSTGAIVWANKYNTIIPSVFVGNDLVVTSDGIISNYSTGGEKAIIKTDFNGNDFWRETINGTQAGMNIMNTVSSKMKLLADGNLVFATGSRGFATQSSIVSIDSSGNFNWSQNIYNSAHDIEQADDNGFFILGNGPLIGVRTSSVTNPHVGIIKSDSLGNADLCTSENTSISINFGTTTQGTIAITEIPYSAISQPISLLNSFMVISELTNCVDVIGGIDEKSDIKLEVYPNPSSSWFNIKLPELTGQVSLSIVDMTGKSVYIHDVTSAKNKQVKIDHKLAGGIYFLVIKSDDKKLVEKLIIE